MKNEDMMSLSELTKRKRIRRYLYSALFIAIGIVFLLVAFLIYKDSTIEGFKYYVVMAIILFIVAALFIIFQILADRKLKKENAKKEEDVKKK